jgi:BirA family biotin operon repressor/biotin-[acetyl-CoA-carboxylase] ligase
MIFPIVEFEVVDSTNDGILIEGEKGAPEGTTHLARVQRRGRGRCERSWWSAPGSSLLMSTLLRPSRSRSDWGGISLVAGAAVRDALEKLGYEGVELFWPNDLQARGRKLGGILCEARSRGDSAWIALGIGINIDLVSPPIRSSIPDAIRSLAISLAEVSNAPAPLPRDLASSVLASFAPLYERFNAGEDAPAIVGHRLAHAGRGVEVRVPGASAWRGTVRGLGRHGELLVLPDGAGSPVPVIGGEVIYGPG